MLQTFLTRVRTPPLGLLCSADAGDLHVQIVVCLQGGLCVAWCPPTF